MAPLGELLYDVRYPRRVHGWGRVLVGIRALLVIPHLLLLFGFALAMVPVTLAASAAILWTGSYPPSMWLFSMAGMAHSARIGAYLLLLRHEYLPFGEHDHGVRFEMWSPVRQSRLLLLARPVLILPHLAALAALWVAVILLSPVAWASLILTGRYPRGLFAFCVGVNRWTCRALVYLCLMTDQYPAFSFGPAPLPPGAVRVPKSWALPATS